MFPIGNEQHSLQLLQHAVGPPHFGQLNGCPHQVSAVFLQFFLKKFHQRHRVGSRAGKPDEDIAVVKFADLFRPRLDDLVAQSHLSVAAHGDLPVLAHADDRRAVNRHILRHFHSSSPDLG